jgi:hypothetical protein
LDPTVLDLNAMRRNCDATMTTKAPELAINRGFGDQRVPVRQQIVSRSGRRAIGHK